MFPSCPSSQCRRKKPDHPRRRARAIRRQRWRRARKESNGGGDKRTAVLELRNQRLCLENIRIMEENQRLTEKALLLRQENELLFSQLNGEGSTSTL